MVLGHLDGRNQEEGSTWELVSHNNRNNSKLIKYLNFKTKAITELGKKWKNTFFIISKLGLSTGKQSPTKSQRKC